MEDGVAMTAQQPPTMETAPAAQPKRKWKVPVLKKVVEPQLLLAVTRSRKKAQRTAWAMEDGFSVLSPLFEENAHPSL